MYEFLLNKYLPDKETANEERYRFDCAVVEEIVQGYYRRGYISGCGKFEEKIDKERVKQFYKKIMDMGGRI